MLIHCEDIKYPSEIENVKFFDRHFSPCNESEAVFCTFEYHSYQCAEKIVGDKCFHIYLPDLKQAQDFAPIETESETYYDGPDGPYHRERITKVKAFGFVWLSRSHWIDKARDVRYTEWYIQP